MQTYQNKLKSRTIKALQIKNKFLHVRIFYCVAFISLCGCWAGSVFASPPIEQMEQTTVRVICQTSKGIGTGSGFLVGNGEHVATNWHVAQCSEENGKLTVLVSGVPPMTASVIWHPEQKDLAILKLEKKVNNPTAKFALSKMVKNADTVYAMGFPAAADAHAPSLGTVKISRGIISAFSETQEHTGLYQIDAAINPGNSGGPLFNEYGQVIGINTLKSLTNVFTLKPDANGNPVPTLTRVPEGEGIGWAIRADELVSDLKKQNIPVNTAGQMDLVARIWQTNPAVFWGIMLACLMSGSTLILLFTAKGRSVLKKAVAKSKDALTTRRYPDKSEKRPVPRIPVLQGISGEYKDAELELDGKPLIMGRDPGICHLVFSSPDISKRHCILSFDAATQIFVLEDTWSSNGTYFADGKQIRPGQSEQIKSGGQFYLSDPSIMFQVNLKGREDA